MARVGNGNKENSIFPRKVRKAECESERERERKKKNPQNQMTKVSQIH